MAYLIRHTDKDDKERQTDQVSYTRQIRYMSAQSFHSGIADQGEEDDNVQSRLVALND